MTLKEAVSAALDEFLPVETDEEDVDEFLESLKKWGYTVIAVSDQTHL